MCVPLYREHCVDFLSPEASVVGSCKHTTNTSSARHLKSKLLNHILSLYIMSMLSTFDFNIICITVTTYLS